eukprot:scaffold10641_cov75-Skeletonema_dohrnii-CCMP3373.AAC.1
MNYPPQHSSPNYPLTNILNPGENDILCGRGGGTNAHSGNIKFRKLVAAHKLRYLAASKSDKPNVARDVVKEWRGMNPPGRFLAKMDVKMMISLNLITVEEIKEEQLQQQQEVSGGGGGNGKTKKKEKVFWYDVGDKKAREKASQCLRERNGAANEAVAALVKTVTANGEACPEDYATLMSKAAKLKEAQQGQDGGFGMQQQQQQMNMYGGGMGGYGGGGGNGGNMGGGGYGGMNNMGGGNVGYCEPVVSGGNGINNVGVGSGSTEDDMIEAEIQRLLREKQEQKMMMGGGGGGNNSNNINNNMGGRGGGGSNNNLNAHNNFGGYGGDVQPYMGEESVLREYQALIQKQQ